MNQEKEPIKNQTEFIGEDEIDLRQYIQVLLKWQKLIIAITILAVLAAGAMSYFVLPPIYRAKTVLMVKQSTGGTRYAEGEDLESVINRVSRMPEVNINTYASQLKTHDLLDRVIRKLSLNSQVYAPSNLSGLITTNIIKDSSLIEINVDHNNPELASQIANTLSSEFLELLSEKNEEQMARSVVFLQQQKEITVAKYLEALKKFQDFETQPRGINVLEQDFVAKGTALAESNSRLNFARVEYRQIQAGVNSLKEQLADIPPTVTINAEAMVEGGLIAQEQPNPVYTNLSQELAIKNTALLEKEAEINEFQEVIADLGSDIEALQAELATKKNTHQQLKSEVDRMEQTVALFEEKITQTQIAQSVDIGQSSVSIVSDAIVPSYPIRPNKKLNIAVAFVLGLMLSVFLAFLLDFFDNTIKTPHDVTRHLDLPVLGAIPLAGDGDYKPRK